MPRQFEEHGFTMGKDYSISDAESERINILKAIAAVMVVFLHTYSFDLSLGWNPAAENIPAWLLEIQRIVCLLVTQTSIPCFYLCASVLMFRKKRDAFSYTKARLKKLIIPYLFFNSLWILIFIVLQSIDFTKTYFSGSSLPILERNFSQWLQLYGIGSYYPLCYPLWFLRDLIAVTFFCPLIWRAADRFPRLSLVCAVLLIASPWEFTFKRALLWTVMGAALVSLDIHLERLDKIPMWLCSVTAALILAAAAEARAYWLDNLYIGLSLIFWLRLTKEIRKRTGITSLLVRISSSAMIIFTCHELAMSSIRKLINHLVSMGTALFLGEFIILPLVMLTFCLFLDRILLRYFPGFRAFVTGAAVKKAG